MAKQTFTTGQVLTAAQMTSLQQTAMLGGAASAKTASYTLVAADAGSAISMSNASATTITVNTALFAAGDTVHITNLGAGVCTITAGTATVNSSASLALAQYESGFLDFTSTSAAIFIKGAGGAAASAVSQMKFATKTDTFSSSSSSYVDITGASVSITPSSVSSKILVMCTFTFSAPSSITQTMFRAMRDSTAIFLGDSSGSRTQATAGSTYVSDFNGQSALTVSFQFIDSPATTSATTYKLQGKSNGNAWYVGRSGSDGDGSNSGRFPLTIIASEVTAS